MSAPRCLGSRASSSSEAELLEEQIIEQPLVLKDQSGEFKCVAR